MPIYYSAMKAVKEIKPGDITELGSFAQPPKAALIVCQTLCMMFKIAAVKVTTDKGKVEDYWKTSKDNILNAKFNLLKKILDYDKDNISP